MRSRSRKAATVISSSLARSEAWAWEFSWVPKVRTKSSTRRVETPARQHPATTATKARSVRRGDSNSQSRSELPRRGLGLTRSMIPTGYHRGVPGMRAFRHAGLRSPWSACPWALTSVLSDSLHHAAQPIASIGLTFSARPASSVDAGADHGDTSTRRSAHDLVGTAISYRRFTTPRTAPLNTNAEKLRGLLTVTARTLGRYPRDFTNLVIKHTPGHRKTRFAQELQL